MLINIRNNLENPLILPNYKDIVNITDHDYFKCDFLEIFPNVSWEQYSIYSLEELLWSLNLVTKSNAN